MSTEKYLFPCLFILQFKLNIWNKSKNNSFQWFVLKHRGFPIFSEWLLLWCLQIVFWLIRVLKTCVYLNFVRRTRCDNLTSELIYNNHIPHYNATKKATLRELLHNSGLNLSVRKPVSFRWFFTWWTFPI